MLDDYNDKLRNVWIANAIACFTVKLLIQNEDNEAKLT